MSRGQAPPPWRACRAPSRRASRPRTWPELSGRCLCWCRTSRLFLAKPWERSPLSSPRRQGGAPGAGSARPGALRGDVPPQSESGRHGTFRDVEERLLPYIAGMGFDVLYLPPIHPIGHTNRKGRNNSETTESGDVGSPWAIGSEEGGHDAIDASLGGEKELRALVADAEEHGIEIALDFAIQC